MSTSKKKNKQKSTERENSTKLKVLEIGPSNHPQARFIPGWEDAEHFTLDAMWDENIEGWAKPDILCDAADIPEEHWGKFDGVFSSHVLEHFPWYVGSNVLQHWTELLKPGGAMHVVVPSLEWAAREILSENPTPAIFPHLYAGQTNEYDIHKTGFTMLLLRKYFEEAGLMVRTARTGTYTIVVLGEPMPSEQHYIMGVKPDII